MTSPMYIDPNSGAAPQPGAAVVGGAASQVGDDESVQTALKAATEVPPNSNMEAEIQRQALLTLEQAKSAEPAEVKTPALAEPVLAAKVEDVEEKDPKKLEETKESQQKGESEPVPAPAPVLDQPTEVEPAPEEEKSDAQKATEKAAREAAKDERENEREERERKREAARAKRETDKALAKERDKVKE